MTIPTEPIGSIPRPLWLIEAISAGDGTDPALQMYTYFYKDREGRPAFPVDSFYDVITGKIPAAKYADKIVLIGATTENPSFQVIAPLLSRCQVLLLYPLSVEEIGSILDRALQDRGKGLGALGVQISAGPKGAPVIDDELAEIEAILKKRGIS